MRISVILLLIAAFLSLPLKAGEPAPERKTPLAQSPAPPPAQAIAAASEKWKLRRLAERAAKPGTTGQQDVLWEILALCEQKPEAREDADLSAIVEYLLFDLNLWKSPLLTDPVFVRVPKLLPGLGERLLDSRVSEWMNRTGMECTGTEPWTWKDFRRIDAGALAASIRRVTALSSKHNPLVRFWGAAALLALEDGEGLKDFPAALADLQRNFPDQANDMYLQVLEQLMTHGIRQALPLVVNQAERTSNGPRPAEGPPVRTGHTPLTLTQRFCVCLGWPPLNESEDGRKVEIGRFREWLSENLQSLTWDPVTRRFRSDVPPPGAEALYAAAQAIEKRWNMKCIDPTAPSPYEARTLIRDLMRRIRTEQAFAEDPAIGDLLTALLESRSLRALQNSELRTSLLQQAPKANRKLGLRLWTSALRDALSSSEPRSDVIGQMHKLDAEFIRETLAGLVPSLQKACETAGDKEDIDETLNAVMALLFAGGPLDRKEMAALLEKGGVGWTSPKSATSPISRWLLALKQGGRTGYLRVLLALSSLDPDDYRKNYEHPLRLFLTACGWTPQKDTTAETGSQLLDVCQSWLDRNEGKLSWDWNRSRFTGALSPEKEALAELVRPLAPYGFKYEELMESAKTPAEMAERLANGVAHLTNADARAAKDQAVSKALVALIDAGKLLDHDPLPAKLLTIVAGLDRTAAIQLWVSVVERSAEQMLQSGQPDSRILQYTRRAIYGTTPPEARLRVAAKYAAQLEDRDLPVSQRLLNAILCAYLGGKVDMTRMNEICTAYERDPAEQRVSLSLWITPLCNTGSITGLRLALLDARVKVTTTSLLLFARLTGLNSANAKDLLLRVPRDPFDGAALYRRWLDENEDSFVWNEEQREFSAPVKKLEELLPPPLVPPAPPPPVVPPRPPEGERKAQGNF